MRNPPRTWYSRVTLLTSPLGGIVAAMLLIALPRVTIAAEPPAIVGKRHYAIPAGPLEHALAAFAAAAGVPLSFEPALVAGKTSSGLNGSYSAQEGFARLLEGSGFELAPLNGGYTLQPQPANSRLPLKPVLLEEVAVKPDAGAEENAWAPVGGYIARRSASATKTDTLINETPQSISVVTREQMEAQGARTVEQALRYTSGVMTEGEGFGTDRQITTIRGFRAAYYLDGLKSFATGDANDWVAEPWALERIEVLKGPASVMYGQGEPGGIINQVSKRPSATALREVQMLVGNYDRYQVAMDVGGKANEEGTLLYRVLGLARDSGTQTPYGKDDRIFLAPALTVKASRDTTLTLMVDVTQDRAMPKSLVNSYSDPRIPDGFYVGEPGLDHYNRDLSSTGYLLEHDFGNDWLFRQTMRYSRNNFDYGQVSLEGFSSSHTLQRSYAEIESSGSAIALDTNIQKRLLDGEMTHLLLLGFDYQNFSGSQRNTYREISDLDLLHPVYGQSDLRRFPATPIDSVIRQNGVYIQDQIRQGRWLASLRLRRDSAFTEASGSDATNAKITHQIGLLYAGDYGLSPYISHSSSFNPKLSLGKRDNGVIYLTLTPETGTQSEIGIKYQPVNADTLLTVALFDLHKQNVSSPLFQSSDSGNAVDARGLELEGKSSLGRQWDLIGSYTYLDAETQSDLFSNKRPIDGRYDGTAKHTAAIWLDYRLANEQFQGWSLGGGLRYSDKIACSSFGDCFTPGYSIVDAALRYSKRAISFAVNVTNLFDKRVAVYGADSITYGNTHFYSASRTVQGTLSYAW